MVVLLLFITYTLNVIDYVFTAYWIRLYGIEVELNPIFRWMFEHDIAWAVKIFVAGGIYALIGYIIKRYPKYAWTAWIPFAVYAGVTLYHCIIAVCIAVMK